MNADPAPTPERPAPTLLPTAASTPGPAGRRFPARAAPASVELHIGELVLHGFAPTAQHRIARAAETELARLIAVAGTRPGWTLGTSVEAVEGLRFHAGAGASPQELGRRLARAIYEGT